jgi:hypothetical protein
MQTIGSAEIFGAKAFSMKENFGSSLPERFLARNGRVLSMTSRIRLTILAFGLTAVPLNHSATSVKQEEQANGEAPQQSGQKEFVTHGIGKRKKEKQ